MQNIQKLHKLGIMHHLRTYQYVSVQCAIHKMTMATDDATESARDPITPSWNPADIIIIYCLSSPLNFTHEEVSARELVSATYRAAS
uniref:Uncharacterized protein n=1 Tax=Oryza punctata TaxID=4537 RepID=A0A0E0LC09_ORYPU